MMSGFHLFSSELSVVGGHNSGTTGTMMLLPPSGHKYINVTLTNKQG